MRPNPVGSIAFGLAETKESTVPHVAQKYALPIKIPHQ